jgi:3-deoxy-D-manno-octulosonic-acid transferase
MQTTADAKRLCSLGFRNTKMKVTGNIKFDQRFSETENNLTFEFRERFGVCDYAPLIIAASTHAPEEKYILEAFKKVCKTATDKIPRLMLVPRHPERFAEVEALISESSFDWVRRSDEPSSHDRSAKIILLDSIGELRSVFPLAEIVFVGGSLIPHGGQNVLEPAAAQKAIVTGFYTMNFKEIVTEFLSKNSLIQLPELGEEEIPERLAEVFTELLQDDEKRAHLAENAFRVVKNNRGAAAKTIEQLMPIFEMQHDRRITENPQFEIINTTVIQ